jgi:phytoene dehydrogenase-like protein
MLLTLGHSHGWPVAVGGSASISTALARLLDDLGGAVTTGVRVTGLDQVRELTGVEPRSGRGVVLLDTAPAAAARILAGAQPVHLARRYHRFRHGPGAFRVDLAVRGGVPWRDDVARQATTLHLGGTADEVADTEGRCWRGEMPSRPFVLVAQQHVVDRSRSVVVDGHDVHPVWAYAHVPAGYRGDATSLVVDQVERFAPAVRERIVGTWRRTVPELTSFDANLVGGDVCGGANDARQLVARPRLRHPYRTGVRGVYLCSSSTPPGAGVHGMCGQLAARAALADLGVHDLDQELVR